MQEQEDFQRYKPQFPLPNDIRNMSRNETVCQFCGVSYLIHNEIKALEEKCEKLQADLAFYSNIDSREAKLKQMLENERSRIADLESTIAINSHKFNELQRKFELIQNENRSFEEKIKFLDECLSELRVEYSNLRDFVENENFKWKKFLSDQRKQIDQVAPFLLRLENENRHSNEQLIVEEKRRIQLEKDVENLQKHHDNLTNDEKTKMNFELEKIQNEKRKLEETSRTRQAVLDRTRDEYEKLLHKYDDLDEIYREQNGEIERLTNENDELTKKDEINRITFELQLKKIRDQYEKLLIEAEKWPDRLQMELTREREQHRNQMMDVERRLKESFYKELNIEKEKFNGLLRKSEEENDQSTEKLRHELISTEKVTIEQRNYYTKQIEQLEKEKIHLKNELNQMRDVLKELHQQIKHQDENEENQHKNLQLKEDLLAKETSLFQAQSIIVELRKNLEETNEQMNTLQETVHRECDEREQLKDALIEARQQLLALKKTGVLNGNVSRSLHSPPVAFAEIERRVAAPLPFSQAPGLQRTKIPVAPLSETNTRDNSGQNSDVADQTARPMSSSNPNAQFRLKALPPIHSQQQRRTKGSYPSLNKSSDQLLSNQRRIARFIKHIK